MSQVKVSVIVPFYGVEPYIGRCAESLLRQTAWQDCEFIFVDDGCKDGSLSVLQGVLARYPERRVQVIRKENGGLPQARLTGLQHATGDYVLHVDSDDWLELDAVEKLVRKAEETDADVVYFYVRKEKGEGRSHVSKDKVYEEYLRAGPAAALPLQEAEERRSHLRRPDQVKENVCNEYALSVRCPAAER